MVGLILAAWLANPAMAQSEDYPSRPVKLVVSYGAGGSLDLIARLLATELSRQLGQSFLVENVPGAGGTLGFRRVLAAPPDGYTLLVGVTSEVVMAPIANRQVGYKASDLDAVAKLGTSGLVLVGRPTLPANNLQELLQLAKAQPGTLRYGTSGAGSLQHLAMEVAKRASGVDIPLVPYKSASQIVTDLAGGHVDLAVVGLPSVLPFIRDGRIKAFGVMSRMRDPGDKSIPSFAETVGRNDIDFKLWTGIFAPKGTPKPIVQKLHAAISAALRQPELMRRYAEIGVALSEPLSTSQFSEYVLSQEREMRLAFENSGIKMDR